MIYIDVTEANSVLHVLISLGEEMTLRDLKAHSALFLLGNMVHGLLAGICCCQVVISMHYLKNSCHTKDITTAIDSLLFASTCLNSDNCCLLISYPLTKISPHQAGADEEDITRKTIFFLMGT